MALIFSLVLLALATGYLAQDQIKGSGSAWALGWDTRATCAGPRAHAEGLDPYFAKNLKGTDLSFTYPPLMLKPLSVLCAAGLERHYVAGYAILVLACLLGFVRAFASSLESGLLAAAYGAGGLAGTAWVLHTGNVTAVEATVLSAVLIHFTTRHRRTSSAKLGAADVVAALAFGLALGFKLVMGPLMVALLILPQTFRHKIKLVGLTFIAYAGVTLGSMLLYPALFQTYVAGITGRIPGQHSPATEGRNPSLYFLIRPFLEVAGLDTNVSPYDLVWRGIYLGLLAAVGLGVMVVLLRALGARVPRTREHWRALNARLVTDPEWAVQLTFWTLFVLSMCAPRLKEYTYLDVVVVSLPLMMTLSRGWGSAALAVSMIPLLNNQPRIEVASRLRGWDQLFAALILMFIFTRQIWVRRPRA